MAANFAKLPERCVGRRRPRADSAVAAGAFCSYHRPPIYATGAAARRFPPRWMNEDFFAKMATVMPRILRTFRTILAASATISALLPSLARGDDALSPTAQRGLVFVRTHCARCHSIDKVSRSPLATALPFRTLHERYPVESLQESLAEGIITGHTSMPEYQIDAGQVADVIAYLKSLER
jgi:cytochrome c